jgi:hypothetical protein
MKITDTKKIAVPDIQDTIELQLAKLQDKRLGRDKQISELVRMVDALKKENAVFQSLKNTPPTTVAVPSKTKGGVSESVAVSVWSDWHSEETVLPEQVSGKNEYYLDKCRKRFERLLRGTLSWFKINAPYTEIHTLVLALLGDFITGSIHDDLAEGNQLPPADAIHFAYSLLVSGIKYLLKNLPPNVEIIAVCKSGNHGRMTKEQRIATEAGNSLEYFMYLMLRDYFAGEKRIKFDVQPGYHSYVNVFENTGTPFVIRLHHGHQINYQGGVGGITIPVNKAIAQWNKARHADLDVFGHFHTKLDGGNFVSNGSMIGYNAYAVSIKASYEKPCQFFFLVNKEYREKTAVMPVFLENA